MAKGLEDVVATERAAQVYVDDVVAVRVAEMEPVKAVLDLGCGAGGSVDLFRRIAPDARYFGVDIESSPEVSARTRTDGTFLSYDGVHLPFDDGQFDLVFARQVFEHVRHPELLLAEVRRVLRPEGFLVGSTSHLEPYHSYSFWNFTPFGFRTIAEDAGLEVVRLSPGIDGLTLVLRRAAGRRKFFNRFWRSESPLNRYIEFRHRRNGRSETQINLTKLDLCGQFVFELRRPK